MPLPKIPKTLFGALTAAALALGVTGMAAATPLAAVPHPATPDTATPHSPTQLDPRWYASAPYLMPLDNDPPAAADVIRASGQKAFQLAFVLAPNGGGCTPTWDGTADVGTDTKVVDVVTSIRDAGGDVSVSTGGYNGTKLGQSCDSAAATAAAYQKVIDKYGLKAIDLDLEEPEYENDAAIARELGAAQILRKNNQGLYVSITMPGTNAGTGWFGQQLLNKAKDLGFTPDNFSIMPFDGGFTGAAAQTAALDAFNGLLQKTFGWDQKTAFAHEGVSLMNGRSDAAEYFRQQDFQTVLDYARGHGLARYTFWSINRDRECDPPDNQKTLGTCSSVVQKPWEFAQFTARFATGN